MMIVPRQPPCSVLSGGSTSAPALCPSCSTAIRALLASLWDLPAFARIGTCQQLWDTRELHLVSLDYGGETREVGAIDVNIDQDLVA